MTALPLTYYVQFRDAAGNLVTGTDGQTWFAVGDVGAGIETTVNLGSSGAAGSAPVFNPLTFTLGTDTAGTALLAAEAAGHVFSQIELAGYSGTGSSAVLVTDDVFDKAAIGSLLSDSDGAAVSVNYGATVHAFYPTDANGNAQAPVVAGYNKATNTADTTPADAPAAPLAGTPPTTDTAAPLTFYVQFRNASGTPVASNTGQTWFAVSGLSVGSEQTTQVTGAGTGAGAGKFTFDPVSFTIDGGALPSLFTTQASGAALGEVEIAGYTGTGAAAELIEDFLDRNAVVKGLSYGADGSQTVALATTDLVQSVIPPAASGGGLALPVPATAGWNTVTNKSDTAADTRASLLGTPAATPAAPLTYYVQFRNGAGAVLAGDGGQTWFAASDVGFGSEQGASAGISADPLTLTLQPDGVLATLFAAQAAGRPLQLVELAGYDSNGTLRTDDAFKFAIPLSDATNADGTQTLAIGYDGFTQTSGTKDVLGQTTPSTQGYNLVTKMPDTGTNTVSGTPGSPLDAPAGAPPPTAPNPGSLTYYVQLRLGNDTLLRDASGKTWFAVTGVGFDTTQTLTSAPATGRVGFGALTFTLGDSTILPTLLQDEAAGTAFKDVELAGYSGAGLVSDDLFKLGLSTADTAQPDGSDIVSLQYGGLLQTAYAPDANGTPAVVASQGWNIASNQADNTTAPIGGGTSHPLAAPLAAPPAVSGLPGPLDYYVQFRDYNGHYLADAAGNTWFDIQDLTLPTGNTANIGSQGSGAGAGHVTFGPVSFTLVNQSLEPTLFQAEAQGTAFRSVEIAGYSTGGAAAGGLVQDDMLKLSAVQDIQNTSGKYSLALAYGGLVERSYVPAGSSGSALANTGGWNAVKNVPDTGTSSLDGTANGAAPVAPLNTPPNTAMGESPPARDYFIQFVPSGATSPLADSGGATFIPISLLSFDTAQTLSIGSQSSGAGAGRISFSPLTFTIAPDSVSATLLSDLASGAAFNTAFVVGYGGPDTAPVKAVEDTLKLVKVVQLATNSDGSETVTLQYGALQETTFSQAAPSQPLQSQVAGWNQIRNVDDVDYVNSGAPDYALPDASPACYCPGTRIATPGGEVAVEQLAEGDLVLTADGRVLPVVWIGRRSYGGRFVLGRRDILPVTIRAGALAEGVPNRDLTVSPEHAMLLDGMLVPAHRLVNGVTIVQAARVEVVHYLHVELPQHEAILANGAASESFVDDNSRNVFHNAHEWRGGRSTGPAEYCAPRVESGHLLEAIRRRIARRELAQAG